MDFSLTRNITICRISFMWIFADQLPEVETRPVQGQVSGARTVTKPHLSFLPYSYPHEIFMTVLEFFIPNWTDIRCVNSNWMRWWSFRFASYFFAPYFSIQFTIANWQDVGYKISAANPLNKKIVAGYLPIMLVACVICCRLVVVAATTSCTVEKRVPVAPKNYSLTSGPTGVIYNRLQPTHFKLSLHSHHHRSIRKKTNNFFFMLLFCNLSEFVIL